MGAGLVTAPIVIFAAWHWFPPLLRLLFRAWVRLTPTMFDFGEPAILKAQPVLQLACHIAIMLLRHLLLYRLKSVPRATISSLDVETVKLCEPQ